MPRLALLCLLLFSWGSAIAQERPTHDVLLYRDSTIARGTVTEVQGNGTTRITTTAGHHRIALWSEIRKRVLVPLQLPDSLLTVEHILFLHRFDDGDNEEDVLILKDETFLRGTLLLSPKKDPARFWTLDNRYLTIPPEKIAQTLRLPKAASDSTIDVYYIHHTPELLADNYRILIVDGGIHMAVGEFASPADKLLEGAEFGLAAGVHASIRVFPRWRWASSVIYSSVGLGLPEALEEIWAVGDPPPEQLLWALTGVEFRTEGTSPWKILASLQAGVVNARLSSFDYEKRRTPVSAAGTGSQSGSTGTGFAFAAGVGVIRGPFSLIARYLSGSVHHEFQTITGNGISIPLEWEFKGDQRISVMQMTIGFSPF
jgi:hypothetical protein